MQTSEKILTLENIRDGAALERFNLAMAEVIQNIFDPNMEATAQREVILQMAFKPSKSREIVNIGFQVKTKLAPLAPVITTAAVGLDARGKGFAREITPLKQQNLPLAEVKQFRKDGE